MLCILLRFKDYGNCANDMGKLFLDKRNGLVHGVETSMMTAKEITKAFALMERLINLNFEVFLIDIRMKCLKRKF